MTQIDSCQAITWSTTGYTQFSEWWKICPKTEIQKQNEGIYYLFNVSLDPESISELERNLKILEPVMRHMIVAK